MTPIPCLCPYCGDVHFRDDSAFCSTFCSLIYLRTDRRTISIPAELYARAESFARDTAQNAHRVLERAICRALDRAVRK